MRRLWRSLVAAFLLVPVLPLGARAQSGASAEEILAQLREVAVIEQKVMVPMRDGVRLATDIFRPRVDEPVPIVLSRTPYNFNWWRDGQLTARTLERALDVVRRGYAYVVQNERGRFFSEGEWEILGVPLTDAWDSFDWLASRPWSNGKIGLLGCSSTAEWQMAAASLGHPALAAIVPMGFGAGIGRVGEFYEQGNWYRGGAQQMLFIPWLYGVQNSQRPTFPRDLSQQDLIRLSRYFDLAPEMPPVDWSRALWHLPVKDILKAVQGPKGIYDEMVRRKPNDPAWYEGGLYHDDMPFGVPSLWFMSWYDVSISPNLELFNHVRRNGTDERVRANQYAVIAPTLHCAYTRASEHTIVGERDLGDARLDYDSLIWGWFDLWLKGEDSGLLEKLPRVTYYTMGSNRWQSADAWPPPEAEVLTYYLSSETGANSLFGDGRLSTDAPAHAGVDSFAYDPATPVPSHGGNVCCTGNAIAGGAYDQRGVEARQDVLVYSTEPLREGVEVTGKIEITLYVSSDARDTDVTVKLLDVYPDGRAFNLDETIQRLRYRDGYDREVFMRPGQVVRVNVSPMSTSNWFAPGHRIRIEVSSSNFPRFDRNLNTGGDNYDETEGVVAHNAVHFGPRYPSQIRLPIVHR